MKTASITYGAIGIFGAIFAGVALVNGNIGTFFFILIVAGGLMALLHDSDD